MPSSAESGNWKPKHAKAALNLFSTCSVRMNCSPFCENYRSSHPPRGLRSRSPPRRMLRRGAAVGLLTADRTADGKLVAKSYAVGLGISCPAGVYYWAPEIPSAKSLAGAKPSTCELAHNRGLILSKMLPVARARGQQRQLHFERASGRHRPTNSTRQVPSSRLGLVVFDEGDRGRS
jgi:hypothetical protein